MHFHPLHLDTSASGLLACVRCDRLTKRLASGPSLFPVHWPHVRLTSLGSEVQDIRITAPQASAGLVLESHGLHHELLSLPTWTLYELRNRRVAGPPRAVLEGRARPDVALQ